MIELARLATNLKEFIESAPIPVLMFAVPGLIITIAIVAIAIATYIEEQMPPEDAGH